ncbi:hypothetical protein A1O1_07889 [Capronia coronata CBS 617.96]|uniref:Uncharacterized protein n=1 Tax=Capronia coronata CBS 617.96 TaxID=1182541 RepID=W9YHR9_9EURO|nr:uncharacterized protein A1O1_07889 [Capronia coronata CBS 617.96]EXJ81824.1 hypothetical protein A1O1_07889 [Capronia coronata CBS 617.96]
MDKMNPTVDKLCDHFPKMGSGHKIGSNLVRSPAIRASTIVGDIYMATLARNFPRCTIVSAEPPGPEALTGRMDKSTESHDDPISTDTKRSGRSYSSSGTVSGQSTLLSTTLPTDENATAQTVVWGPIIHFHATHRPLNSASEGLGAHEKRKTNIDNTVETPIGDESDTDSNAASMVEPREGSSSPAESDDSENDTGTSYSSAAETIATDLTAHIMRPPPPTPPDSIFHPTLSMPTLPTIHHISDATLVEQYRLQRAHDPEAFDQETQSIKRGLIAAKIARGGKDKLLKNEYTVELASREDAATAERWASGRASRNTSSNHTSASASSVKANVELCDGEVNLTTTAAGTRGELNESLETAETSKAPKIPETVPKDEHDPVESIMSEAMSHVLQSRFRSFTYDTAYDHGHTSLRRQQCVTKEVNDGVERHTIKTWIELTDVYDTPKVSAPQPKGDQTVAVNDYPTHATDAVERGTTASEPEPLTAEEIQSIYEVLRRP